MSVGIGEARPAVNDAGLDGMSADKDGGLEGARRGVPGRAAGADGRTILAQPVLCRSSFTIDAVIVISVSPFAGNATGGLFVGAAGLEPATFAVSERRSNQIGLHPRMFVPVTGLEPVTCSV